MQADELLYSLVNFVPVTRPLLDALPIRHVVEIGCERGAFTGWLAGYAASRGARLTVVDVKPRLDPALASLEHVHVVAARSVDFLAHLEEAADVYFVDGEHSYATVSEELRRIDVTEALAVFVHDTSWPWGKRDAARPDAERDSAPSGHRDVYLGLHDDGMSAAGLPAARGRNVAARAGGPRNGVRTAVDDFLAASGAWSGVHVQGCFGLAVLWRPGALTPEQDAAFESLRAAAARLNGLLATVELGRLHALCELHRAREEVAYLHARRARRKQRPMARLRRAIRRIFRGGR